jgi:hypothetical protein
MNPSPVVRRVRGYFAPVNRGTGTPVVFDPAQMAGFSLDAPPAPWVSLGWIRNFARRSGSKTSPVMTGTPATVLEQARELVDAQVSFQFLSWTKLTMALATGSQHMNLLMPASGAAASADGAAAAPAVGVQSGATATMLPLGSADAAKFTAGQWVAVDVDYAGQTGFIGSPVAGAYVKAPLSDVDYVRRVTFNVATVASVTTSGATGLTLADALPGGVPVTAGGSPMKVQALSGFVDREGGTFFQEWSGLFVMEGSQGERVCFYYPRLQPMCGAAEVAAPLNAKQGGTLERVLLEGSFRAMPVTDGLDGERVVCYRSFVPAGTALL